MATEKLQFVVITPERQVLEGEADSIVIPAHDGELGVLVQRAPLMCELGIGQMRFRGAGTSGKLFIDGGFAQVYQNRVTVLTPRAVKSEDITGDMIQTAEARAKDAASPPAERALAARRAATLRDLKAAG